MSFVLFLANLYKPHFGKVNLYMVDMLTRSRYLCCMDKMHQIAAKWRGYMTDRERDELALAERVRDASADQLRTLTKRLKDRCIKRMRRRGDREAK